MQKTGASILHGSFLPRTGSNSARTKLCRIGELHMSQQFSTAGVSTRTCCNGTLDGKLQAPSSSKVTRTRAISTVSWKTRTPPWCPALERLFMRSKSPEEDISCRINSPRSAAGTELMGDSTFTSPTKGRLKTQRSSSVTGSRALTCWGAAKSVPSGSAASGSGSLPGSLATEEAVLAQVESAGEAVLVQWVESASSSKCDRKL
eukprot:Skav230917  [mRNA]  locus=scaffold2578:77462:84796:+ [translate_table: standard]